MEKISLEMEVDDEASIESNKEKEELERAVSTDKTKNKVTQFCKFVSGYTFDIKKGDCCVLELRFPITSKKLLMAAIVEQVCKQVTLCEIKGISRCYPMLNETENDTSASFFKKKF
jgi:DNA-directed RNA polymerase I subunit RPA1